MQSIPNYYTATFQPTIPFNNNSNDSNGNGSIVITMPTPTPILSNNNNSNSNILPPLNQNLLRNPIGTVKRNQVKNACTNCQKACKKCDDARPCPRCVKYGVTSTCVNSVRKERKKGIKRGPYKRRQKSNDPKNSNENHHSTVAMVNVAHTTNTNPNTMTTNTAITTLVNNGANTNATGTPTNPNPNNPTPTTDFGYPSQLSQYTPNYQSYHYGVSSVVYNTSTDSKDHHLLPSQYVLPVYSSYPPSVLVDGDNNSNNNQDNKDKTVDSNETDIKENNKENSVDNNNTNQNNNYLAHQAFGIILNNTNNESTNPSIYYQPSDGLESTKQDDKKLQPLTPVPSTSNSSDTASPSENQDESVDDDKFTRLTELCTAALEENKNKAKQEDTPSNDPTPNTASVTSIPTTVVTNKSSESSLKL